MRLSVRQVSVVATQFIQLLCEDTVAFAQGNYVNCSDEV